MNKPFDPARIDIALLIRCGINPNQAREFERPLRYACDRYQINTTRRLAAFLGQCAVESADFTRLEEGLYYTTAQRVRAVFGSRVPTDAMAQSLLRNPQALANRVYANLGGNGDETSGDGWKYRGRGIIQLTLKGNYTAAAQANQRPYVEQPELVARPADAAFTAAWYWGFHDLNTLADGWQTDDITRRINKGMAGRMQRRTRCDELLEILNDF